MTLPEATVDKLKALLKASTALVVVDGKPKGSAVFVDDDLVLTCEHVVRGGTRLDIQPFTGALVPAVDVVSVLPDLDVALLRIPAAQVVASQPCAALGGELVDGPFSVVGYPREDGHEPGIEVRDAGGHTRQDAVTGAVQLLQIDPGVIVTFGNSGGPVFSQETGAVVALARTSKDAADALGGGAVPVSRAAAQIPELAALLREPPAASRRWRDALGSEAWAQLGYAWDPTSQIEVVVQEDEDDKAVWRIGVDPAPIGRVKDQVGPNLGSDIGDALFRWAQRQRTRDDDEVLVLGRLLAGALFPPAFTDELERRHASDQVIVRLTIAPGSTLADIPWELCAVPSTQDRFLSTDEQYLLVRTLPDRRPPAPATDDVLHVAAVVALPGKWDYPVVYGDERYEYPAAADVAYGLTASIEGDQGGRVRSAELVNPRLGDIRPTFADGPTPFRVFHLMAVGRTSTRDGRETVQVALANERATVQAQLVGASWYPLESILATAVGAGATVAVLQLLLPSVDSREQPLTLKALAAAIPDELDSVVVTRFPVHPRQAQEFNDAFYDELRAGRSVEAAVQAARRELSVNKPIEDSSGFGWFCVLTRGIEEVRLLVPVDEVRLATPGRPAGPVDRE